METDKQGTVVWSIRKSETKRRRHEVTFSAKVGDGDYREFLSRPGLFAYGRLDDGTRAFLMFSKCANERVWKSVADAAAGIIAAIRRALDHLTMIDSNARAIAVAKENVQRHQLANTRLIVSIDGADLPGRDYDLVIANPPYFAQQTITRKFAEQARRMMKFSGRFYLVTKQLDTVLPIVEEFFGEPLVLERRGYAVIVATRQGI